MKQFEYDNPTFQKLSETINEIYEFQEIKLIPELELKHKKLNGNLFTICDFLVINIHKVQLYDNYVNEFEKYLKEINSFQDDPQFGYLIQFIDENVIKNKTNINL